MKSGVMVIKGKASDVLKQLRDMKPEDFEALKNQALNRGGCANG